jgi:hypothetical protein
MGGVSPVPLIVAGTDATPKVLVATVSVAVVAPAAMGSNISDSVQLALAASVLPAVVPQGVEPLGTALKAAAPGPLNEKLGAAIAAPPVFEIVSEIGLLCTPSSTLPKAKLFRERESNGGLSPNPFSATV